MTQIALDTELLNDVIFDVKHIIEFNTESEKKNAIAFFELQIKKLTDSTN